MILSGSVVQIQVVCWIQPVGWSLVDVLATHPGELSLTFSRSLILTCLLFFLCRVLLNFGGKGQEFLRCVSWAQLRPLMVKCSSHIGYFCGLGQASPAVGTQGCLHAGVRKIPTDKERIPLRWWNRSRAPELWAAIETSCSLVCLKSLIFTPRIELHFTHTFLSGQHLMIMKASLSFTQLSSPNKAWGLWRVGGDKIWGGVKDVSRVTARTHARTHPVGKEHRVTCVLK